MSEGSSLQPPTAPQGRRQGLSHTVRVPPEWERHVPLKGGLDARRGLAGLVVEPLWGGAGRPRGEPDRAWSSASLALSLGH